MSEVLVEFDTVVIASDRSRWIPRACGARGTDGLWQGWIEFLDIRNVNAAVRTERETTQPNRDDLMYWAQGLTQTYLEGALVRARADRPVPTERISDARPRFSGPALRVPVDQAAVSPRPILNPFEVYQQGEDILLRELDALAPARLRDLVIAYGFASPNDAYGAGRATLSSYIVAGVRRPLGSRSREDASRDDSQPEA